MIYTQLTHDKNGILEFPEGTEFIDYKTDPEEILVMFDKMLEPHGLTIESFDTGGDYINFRIVKNG
jgi:hypothetical protein